MLEYQITKMTWLKGTTTNWSEGDFVIKKVKQYSVMDINDLNGEKIIGTFQKKELQKINKKEIRVKKVIKKNVISCTSNRKAMISHSKAG